jgi:predicted HTH transcriptional regulator
MIQDHPAQLGIDFVHTRARRTDPMTSHAAAIKAVAFSASHAGQILAVLKKDGPRSPHELSQVLGLTVVQIDRRLPDLKAKGLARPTGIDRGPSRVWEAVK